MSTVTQARPYAKAAFAHAEKTGQLAAWSSVLDILAQVTNDENFQVFVNNPHVTDDQVYQMLSSFIDKNAAMDPANKSPSDVANFKQNIANFVRLLIEKQRVLCLPAISQVFQTLLQAKNQIMPVSVVSAFTVPAPLQEKLQKVLTKQLGVKTDCQFSVDNELVGGLIIYAGDRVLDYSIKTRLHQLYATLEG